MILIISTYYFRKEILEILVPLFIGVAIAYVIYPLVVILEKQKISRTKSIIFIYCGAGLTVCAIGTYLIPEILKNTRELINIVPNFIEEIKSGINEVFSKVNNSKWPPEIKKLILNGANDELILVQNKVLNFLKNNLMVFVKMIPRTVDLVLGMIMGFYLIKDSKLFKKMFLAMLPSKRKKTIVDCGMAVNKVILGFIQGQIVTALIVAAIQIAALFILKIKYPFFLGLLGGISNIIPYFGPVIGIIPATFVALIDSPFKALLTVIVFIIIQQIDNIYITPRIIEGKLGLHPIVSILSIIAGGKFLGIFGMIIAIPLVAVVMVITKMINDAISGYKVD